MKIAYFTDTYFPQINGVTVSIENFVRELRKQGHSVTVFAPKITNHKDEDRDIVRLPSFQVLSSIPEILIPLPVTYGSLKGIFSKDFDLIHAHGNGAFSLLGHSVARMKNIPYILTFHTQYTEYTHYFLNGKVIKPDMIAAGMRAFAQIADGIVAPSEKMRQELVSYGVHKDIQVIPSFIDFSSFSVKSNNFLHNFFNLDQSIPLLLTVSRLEKEKNIDFIISVFSKLAEVNDLVHLVIVGKGSEIKHLKDLAVNLHLESRVHFTDVIENKLMPYVYSDASLFVFVSDTETQGLCVLEAAACGLPVVILKDLAYKNLVFDGVNGYNLPLQQDKFVEKLKLLLQDHALREQMGEASIKISRKNFDPNDLTDQMLTFYNNVLSDFPYRGKSFRHFNKTALLKLIKLTSKIDRLFDM